MPGVLALDAEGEEGSGRGGWMLMEWIEGATVRDVLVRCAARAKLRRSRRKGLDGPETGSGAGDGEGQERRTVVVNGEGRENGEGNDCREANGEEEDEGVRELMTKIGRAVGKMHSVGVIHGDLTTSNMMLRPKTSKRQAQGVDTARSGVDNEEEERNDSIKNNYLEGDIVLIDFGLSGQSIQEEDQAVDLYVLERAFGSTHPEAEDGFHQVLQAYGAAFKGAKVVLKRLEDVRMRGRKKSMIG